MGEIASYHKRDWLSPFFGCCRLHVFWPFFGLLLCLPCDGSHHRFLLELLDSSCERKIQGEKAWV